MKLSFAIVFVAVIVTGAGCNHARPKKPRGLGGAVAADDGSGPVVVGPDGQPVEAPPPPPVLITSDATVEFDVEGDGGGHVVLGARVVSPEGAALPENGGPVVVVVPGGGDVSKAGTRKGDGVVVYDAPVDTGVAWSRALGLRGATVLTYDKRTCGPNDDATCHKNPQQDLDEQGPVALAKDVDAACAVAKAQPAFDGRLILWAHGQAAQVALSSTCAREAAAIVLLSPVPRPIDAVLVDALVDRQKTAEHDKNTDEAVKLRNYAGTRAAEFAAMKKGKFAKDARVGGATTAFWLGWIDLTTDTPALLEPVKDKVVVVVGNGDLQLSAADREAARRLPARQVVVVDADHHLLTDGNLDDGVVKAVADAIDVVIGPPHS
jgi:hypothetical protein